MTDVVNRPTIEERVAAGVRGLDERGPEGWRDRLDLDVLNVGDPEDCVIGQLFGGRPEGYRLVANFKPGDAPLAQYFAGTGHLTNSAELDTSSASVGLIPYNDEDWNEVVPQLNVEWVRQVRGDS